MSKVNIELDDDEYKVTMPYDDDAKEALKEKFRAWWDPEAKAWSIDASRYSESDIEQELKLHFPREFR